MSKITSIKFLINALLLVVINFFAVSGYAEGTPSLSPNAANITGILSAPDITAGPYVNASEDNRIKFYINNNGTENLYFGFDARGYVNTGSSPRLGANTVFYRIYKSTAPTVVLQQGVWNPTLNSVGSIDTHAEGLAGPNINGVTTGYSPFVFNPDATAAQGDGEYFISIYRSSTADGNTPVTTGTASRVFLPLFDLTVASGPAATATTINGRVYSDKWSFAAADLNFVVTAGTSPANAEPVFHAYTDDQTVVRIEFEPGFQPIAFNIAVNKYGVVTPGAWTTTRRSVNSATTPALANGYKVFVNIPDATVFPTAIIPASPTFLSPAVSGCGPTFNINYNVAAAGDVQILLNLDGVPGYQTPGPDRILEALDVSAGNNTLVWDGLNGVGAAVPSGTNFNLALTFLKGRFNLPLYDAELNKNGVRVSLILPVPLANSRIYWDDSGLTSVGAFCDATTAGAANNTTGTGLDNSFVGTISPAHAWSGNGNTSQTIPAPFVGTVASNNENTGLQCDDFGNVRVINTWGWGYTSNATNLNITLGCANLSITKGVSNSTPTVGTNVTFTLTAQNLGTVTSSGTVVTDLLPAGYTYVSDNGAGAYTNGSGNWTIGTLASGASTSLQIVATVNASGPYANTATITGNQADPSLANNTSSVTPTPVNAINAVDDPATTVASGATPTPAGSVLGNDTLNGVAVTTANTDVTPGSNGPISIDANGNLTVAPNTPSGTYTITYQLCETASPANCDTAVATVIVANPINAVDDPATTVASGATPTPAGSVLGNDTLNGIAVTTANTDVTPGSNGPISIDANGNLTVAPNTPSGTYTITYQLCETGAVPANCDTAVATVIVANPINAVDDPATTVASGATPTPAGSVLGNDTLNGVAVTTANTDVTPGSNGPISIDANGNLTVAPNTPSGTYTITYELCETGAVPANCDTAVATVIVANPINAVDDPATTVASGATPTPAGSVLGNDTLNGVAVTTANTDVTPGSNGPISIDANGNLTVAPNTPSGTYTITYQLCETGAVPANCDTAVATVNVVAAIDAVNDTPSPINGLNGGTTPSALVNDTLNGTPVNPSDITLTPVSVPSGLTLNPDGTITVAPGTPAGTYPVVYQICEIAVPTNCDTATASVVVDPAPIDAVIDDYTSTPINGSNGGTTPSVLVNDTLNGTIVNPSDITLTGITVPAGLTLNPDGTITVAPGTPANTYVVTYTICENLNPSNCDTTTATVLVNPAVIDAVNDTPSSIASAPGGTTPSVLLNDTLNGVILTPSDVTLTAVSVPSGLTLNPDGTITVAPGTPNGTYPVVYQICEVLNPTNCDTATASVVVAAIDAVNDTPSPINGLNGGTTPSVLVNDTLNGTPVNPSDITLTPVSVPSELTLNPDGTITVAPGTPAGTYPVVYQICEIAVPTNCDTATASVVVDPAPIDAVIDDYTSTPINGSNGGTTASVLVNDTLNGTIVNPSDITLTGITVPAGLTLNPDGTITVAPGTPANTYVVTYTICENLNPSNCDTTTATVLVNPAVIDAINDTPSSIASAPGGTTPSVLLNDTLNGVILTPSDVTLTAVSVPSGLTLNPDGTITVAPGTPNGTYPVVYQICEVLNPTNCDTATASVVVAAIDAVNDTPSPINGLNGGTTPSVLVNDTLNGTPVNPSDITLTLVSVPSGLTLNPDGTITVAPGTPAGTYPVVYQICEIAVPANCDTTTASVVVDPAPIDAVIDDYTSTPINGSNGGTTPSVLVNDTLNGTIVNPSDITLTGITVPAGLTLNPDGTITVAPGTPANTYVVTYTICENLNPSNCDTTTATVLVNPAVIDAVNDTPSSIASAPGGTTPSVLLNDTLNGTTVNPSDIILTAVSVPSGLTLNPDGTITVAPGTPNGTYPVVYQICEVLNPTNCDTATATVVVAAIDAVNDTPSPINGLNGGTTPSVLVNDTLNGTPVNPSDITLTPVSVPSGLTLNPDGTITVAPGTPAGTYPVVYQICEIAVPTNCDTATASVVVDPAPIDAVIDNYTSTPINGSNGGTTPSVLVNDTLNGTIVTPSDITLTGITVPAGLTLNPDGTITVAPGTPANTYVVTYTICENLNPSNCDTTTATVLVNPAVIDAVNDTPSSIASAPGGTTPSVLLNDTLNGIILTPSDVTLTAVSVPSGLTLNPDGTITVAPGTPSGTYSVVYQICEVLNPTNCDTATATVVVAAIDAVNDTPSPINGLNGGTTPSVLVNDTLNGTPVNPSDITLTPVSVPSGLTLNPDGTITVAPGTPAGTYPVVYQICEIAVPTNCDTATASVVVDPAPIDAVIDNYTSTPINGSNGGTTPSVLVNDTLNGTIVNPSDITLTGITVPAGLTLNPDGTITVAPGTPANTYVVTYTICENLNPSNCDTTTATVLVNPAVIDAVNDTPSSIASAPGGTTPSVLLNDTLNGVILTPSDVTLTAVSVPSGLTLNPDGTITVAPGTPNGTYPVVYQICEVLNPTNCDTATATVVVVAMDAIDDNFGPIPSGGTTPSVLINDTLNGTPVNPSDITLTPVSVPSGLTLNPNGTITIAPGTPTGTYTVVYQICEIAIPTNCDTATATIIVSNLINAVDDDMSSSSVNGYNGNPSVVNAYTNDTLNGIPVVVTQITGTILTPAVPLTPGANVPVMDPVTGIVSVPSQTPAGIYTITYQICENGAVPTNCDTAIVTIVVGAAPIVANDDDMSSSPVNGYNGNPSVVNVYTNDTLNGLPVVLAEITGTILTPATPLTPGANVPVMDPVTGIVSVPSQTPAGTYTITYQICEVLNPTNCDTAIVTVVVGAAPIVANDDDMSSSPVNGYNGNPNLVNAYTNDTLNGLPVVLAEITGTILTPAVPLTPGANVPVMDPVTGIVSVPSQTPAGTYTITYQICEVLNPTNCDTAIVTVVVGAAPIVANDDDMSSSPVNGYNGNPNLVNVYTNDTLNGLPVVVAEITGTILTPAVPLTPGANVPVMDPVTGIVSVPSQTPAGTYTITYQICEVLNPTNCDTAIVTVVVGAAPIVANDDDMSSSPVNGYNGNPNLVNAYTNDTLNGLPVVVSEITGTILTPAVPVTPGANVPVMDPVTGIVSVPSQTPVGTYTITYQICEILNPTNCDTAIVTIVVTAAPIDAINDDMSASPVNGYNGNPNLVNAYTNDTLNGLPVVVTQITGAILTPATPLTPGANVPVMDLVTGIVSVPSQTPAGTYTITYQICEVLNPTNCDTAIVTVVVAASPIIAEDDNLSATPVNGFEGGIPGNIFDNNGNGEDTLNALPVLADEVTISILNDGGLTGVVIDDNGDIIVPAGTPSGTYIIEYQICDVLNPTNCDNAFVTIAVIAPVIDAVDNDFSSTPINSDTGGTVSIFGNDTLNNDPIDPDDITVTIIDNGGIVGATVSPTGVIDIPAGTPPGTYVLTYQICQVLNPGVCDTATVIIVVKEPCDLDDAPDYCDVIIRNAVTNNNDGLNDYLILEGIERFPNNSVTIYNRWGVKVYDVEGYDNDAKSFKGISEGRVTVNQSSQLPEGTYFYVVKYTKTSGVVKEKAGYLYINR